MSRPNQNRPRPVLTALAVVAVVGAFVAGNDLRGRQETGRSAVGNLVAGPGILASREPLESADDGQFFYQLLLLLQREYVDDIPDERKLAYGAVRGMVLGLLEPGSSFMKPAEMAAYKARQRGEFAGIGIEVELRFDEEELDKARQKARSADPLLLLPAVIVTTVAPGSPADQAGIVPGVRIVSIDGKALVSGADVQRLRDLQAAVEKKQAKPEEFEAARVEFQELVEHTMNPNRAREVLTTGTGKALKVAWLSGARRQETTLTTAKTQVPPAVDGRSGPRFRFVEGAAKALRAMVDAGAPIKLDLRGSGSGDFEEMRRCLSEVAPSGPLGYLSHRRGGEQPTLTVGQGRENVPPITLVVDDTTSGAARVFAAALSAAGLAGLDGELSGPATWVESVELADGSGYTLVTGRFQKTEEGK
jgi:C-terminal processing protease CtpA/Prc